MKSSSDVLRAAVSWIPDAWFETPPRSRLRSGVARSSFGAVFPNHAVRVVVFDVGETLVDETAPGQSKPTPQE